MSTPTEFATRRVEQRLAPPSTSSRLRRRAAWAGATLAGLVAALALASNERIESMRATLEKWVETRRQISEERLDWTRKRETLLARMEVLQRELDGVGARLAETREEIAQQEAQGVDLGAGIEKLRETSKELAALVTDLESRTIELLARVPAPVRERVKPFSQRIPVPKTASDVSETASDVPKTASDVPKTAKEMPLSERFQNVVAILNDVNKAASEIFTASEIRTLADGRSAEVTALYIGISKGYSIDGSGTIAAVGWGGPQGWIWTPADEAAPEIAKAIAILSRGGEAQFVRVPVQVP